VAVSRGQVAKVASCELFSVALSDIIMWGQCVGGDGVSWLMLWVPVAGWVLWRRKPEEGPIVRLVR